MKLVATHVDRSGGEVRLVGTVEKEGTEAFELFFAFPAELEPFVADGADAFVPALLVPSLKTGEDLEIVPPVSPRLLRRLRRIQDVLVTWHAPFRRVSVVARELPVAREPTGSAVGALFSSGVDSFYTLLKSRRGSPAETPPVSHLVFLRGLETPLEQSRGVDESQRQVEEIARELGLRVIVGRSNLRSVFTLNYELYYHGAALVSTALALSAGLRYLLVPSSNSYAQVRPWGTDPLLDPLWSTESLEVVHDGCEARRTDKLEMLVAGDPLALKYLRVCLENSGGAYNCCRCRKCARTMVGLALLGALDQARTFPATLSAETMRLLWEDSEELDKHVVDLLDLARRTGRRPDLTRMLERLVRRRRRRRALRELLGNTPVLDRLLPWLDGARRTLRGAESRHPGPPAGSPRARTLARDPFPEGGRKG